MTERMWEPDRGPESEGVMRAVGYWSQNATLLENSRRNIQEACNENPYLFSGTINSLKKKASAMHAIRTLYIRRSQSGYMSSFIAHRNQRHPD